MRNERIIREKIVMKRKKRARKMVKMSYPLRLKVN